MNLKKIAELAEEIVLNENEKNEMIFVCQERMKSKKKRQAATKLHFSIAVAILLLVVSLASALKRTSDVTVSAASISGEIQLKPGAKAMLEEQQTPLGTGYVIKLNAGENAYFCIGEDGDNSNVENIFQRGNTLYWLPDGMTSGMFRSENGDVINLPKTDSSTLKIKTYSYGQNLEDMVLLLERGIDGCSVELLEN